MKTPHDKATSIQSNVVAIHEAAMNSEQLRFANEISALDKRVPPPAINFNQAPTSTSDEYIDLFKRDACLKILPFLMRRGRLQPDSVLLDYGCGLGRLAYSASHYLSSKGAYFGYEPNQTALAFLRTAYGDLPNFHFAGAELDRAEDYVAIKMHRDKIDGIKSIDVQIVSFVTRPVDVQFSSSVFTHMWRDAIVSILRQCLDRLSPDGICINTWLIVDDFAAYVLRCGLADRVLPFKVNGAWTYLEDNPLMCTAYELCDVQQIYADAGHAIEDILWGSWSGRGNVVHYQDVVVSRKL